MSSPHCTHHPVLPRNQVLYLFDALIDRSEYLKFDFRNYGRADWDVIADKFNAEFEGKRVPGSAEPQTKKCVEMLYCALKRNSIEFRRLHGEAVMEFRSKKKENAEGERHWLLWQLP